MSDDVSYENHRACFALDASKVVAGDADKLLGEPTMAAVWNRAASVCGLESH